MADIVNNIIPAELLSSLSNNVQAFVYVFAFAVVCCVAIKLINCITKIF